MNVNKWAVAALSLTIPVVSVQVDMCDCSEACYSFNIGAEALYWAPCNYQNEYGVFRPQEEPPRTTTTKRIQLSPKHEWGFRIFGSVADKCECNFVSLEWAHVSGTTRKVLNAGDERLAFGDTTSRFFDQVSGSQKTRYNKVSLKIGHQFVDTRCARLYGYLGARYGEIWVEFLDEALKLAPGSNSGFPTENRWRTKFSGGGLETGIAATYDLWCGFGLNARIGLHSLIGEQNRKVKNRTTINNNTSVTIDSSNYSTSCVGGYEMRIGLTYQYECGCWWVRGEVGYEHTHYSQALIFPQSGIGFETIPSDFGIGGLFFGLTTGF